MNVQAELLERLQSVIANGEMRTSDDLRTLEQVADVLAARLPAEQSSNRLPSTAIAEVHNSAAYGPGLSNVDIAALSALPHGTKLYARLPSSAERMMTALAARERSPLADPRVRELLEADREYDGAMAEWNDLAPSGLGELDQRSDHDYARVQAATCRRHAALRAFDQENAG